MFKFITKMFTKKPPPPKWKITPNKKGTWNISGWNEQRGGYVEEAWLIEEKLIDLSIREIEKGREALKREPYYKD